MGAEPKYTPGPWQALGRSLYTAHNGGNDITPATAAGKGEEYLALMAEKSTYDLQKANGCLIAAAPELLAEAETNQESLNTLIDSCRSWSIEQIIGHCMAMQMRNALIIAKAKGA